MIIYGMLPSPFVRKALMFAAEKGVDAQYQPGGFGQGGDEFAQASPFGKIPAMRVSGANADGSDFLLADSTAICVYIDAAYSDNPLIPADPQQRARVFWFDEFADTIMMAAGQKVFFNRVVLPLFMDMAGNDAAAAEGEAHDVPRVLNWLEQEIGDKDFLVGDGLTLADISVAAPLVNLREGGIAITPETYPNIARWSAAIEARPSLARSNGKMTAAIAQARAAKSAG